MCSIYNSELGDYCSMEVSYWSQNWPIILGDKTTESDIIAETGNGNLGKNMFCCLTLLIVSAEKYIRSFQWFQKQDL
jgi:hypothetical protein